MLFAPLIQDPVSSLGLFLLIPTKGTTIHFLLEDGEGDQNILFWFLSHQVYNKERH
jgi:hypothetical protein